MNIEGTLADRLETGRRSLVHDPAEGDDTKILLTKARGSSVWDADGREYIDCTAMAWSNNLGANDPRVVQAAIDQLRRITHARPNFNTDVVLELTSKLVELSPGSLNRVGYSLHGSLAAETAMKLAFRNRPEARNLLVLQDAYHGRSIATLAASWPHPDNVFGPLQPSCFTRVPHPNPYRPRLGMDPEQETLLCLDLLRDVIEKGVDGTVAALMMEPIQGNGGHIEFTSSYYHGVRDLCDEFGILLIWDEVQTSFGRTGEMFAADYYGVVPDIIAFGKGVGGGFPLAGILADERLRGFETGDDQLTFGQFPVSMAAGLAAVTAMIDDDLPAQARDSGEHATGRLLEMQTRHPLIGDVRCPGLMVSIELVEDRETKRPARRACQEVYRLGLERGVLFGESRYAGLGNLIKIKPPLDIPRRQLDRALDVLDEVLGVIEHDQS